MLRAFHKSNKLWQDRLKLQSVKVQPIKTEEN